MTENNQKSSYEAKDITVLKDLRELRKKYDFNWLLGQIKKRGDIKELAEKLKIDRSVLCRALEEAKLLSIFPNITTAKVTVLSRLKTLKEKILFSKKYNLQKISCRNLYKLIKIWRDRLEKDPRELLTNEQHDLIIGSTLGDSNIRQKDKNCLFRVAHSRKQEEYLYWKYSILKEFTMSNPYWNTRKFNSHKIETLQFSTFTHSVFNCYRRLFYKTGKKKITKEILAELTLRSLAIWICDDGSYDNTQGYIVLCTNSYSLQEHRLIKEYFEKTWNLSPTIGFRDNKYYYLRFKQDDSKRLIEIVKPFITNFMRYKIGEKNG